jgi:hypothetical protein
MSTMKKAALWMGLAVCAVAPALSGCQSVLGMDAPDLPDPEGWVESRQFECFDEALLWETCKNLAQRNGYRIDDDATKYKEQLVVTTWKVQLAITRNDGKRRRRYVEMVKVPNRKAGWKVRCAVVKQKNEDIEDPLNPLMARWRTDVPDVEQAKRLAYLIENRFREPGPSPEFEDR